MQFVVSGVKNGTEGTTLELFGIRNACQMLSFEKSLGNEVIGTRLGIV